MNDQPLVQRWLKTLSDTGSSTPKDRPKYWHPDPKTLLATSTIHNLTLGAGSSIYTHSIIPLFETAEHEVILVTCFWARSRTLDVLNDCLRKLSAKGQRLGRRIRVRIYFSSSSLFQKLLHPQTLTGKTWEPETWTTKLSLPGQEEMKGLDVRVKSVFLLPFSVMHPKFVIVDRKRVLLPSCNVSWEDWFEGCVGLSGEIVGQFVRFWREFWVSGDDAAIELEDTLVNGTEPVSPAIGLNPLAFKALDHSTIRSIFLPSPHHRNPSFAPLPWQPCPPPPSTPLNSFLLEAVKSAQQSIYIQTPNLTAPPILSALLDALRRGVDVTVLTSEKLMILEQLATAGTTTAKCIGTLVKRYKRINQEGKGEQANEPTLLESGTPRPGDLRISFYQPLPQHLRDSAAPEPVQSHLKLTIIDEEWTVLGSGNLDRASLFTSQELGVAFHSREFAVTVREEVRKLMDGRSKLAFPAAAGKH